MSETNVWRKRTTLSILCPSTKVAIVRRPSPELALRAGKIARMFQRQKIDAATDVERQLDFIESLTDEEINKLTVFARALLVNVMVEPRVFLNPTETQLEPDDLPNADFWFLFLGAMNGWPDMPIKLADGEETTVEAVATFPDGQGTSSDSGEDGVAM